MSGRVAPDVDDEDLAKAARTRVFFGHQSVGRDVLEGVRAVFAKHGVAAPPIIEGTTGVAGSGAIEGVVAHALLGRNEQPLLKIQDFDAAMRGGLGGQVDVAMMKLCYIDIAAGTDVDGLFAAYRDAVAALRRDFPRVAFVAVTVPLTTEPGRTARLKAPVARLLGRDDDRFGRGANVARERFNAMIRREYADDPLFDLAGVESTAPDGSRVSGSRDGRSYFALHGGYATDAGHLNAEGSQAAAAAWLTTIARASTR